MSSFCIFRVYISSILSGLLFCLNSQYFTYIFECFPVFHVFHIFRFFWTFYLKFFILSFLLCFFFCLENTLSTDFCLEPSNVFLIPTMLKDWWFWWDIHRNGQIFYDLASLKLQSVVKINYEKMVGHLFIDSTSLVTQKALTCLVPRGEIFQIWPDQIAQNCHLRLLQRFLWVVPLHQTGDWWIWVHDKMCMKNISVSIAFNDTYMEKRDSVQKFMEIQGWLLLTFFICLHYQLSSFNSIIVQMSEKHDSSSRQ